MERTDTHLETMFLNKIYSPMVFILWENHNKYSMGFSSKELLEAYAKKTGKRTCKQWINKILNDLIKIGIVESDGTRGIFFYSITPSLYAFLTTFSNTWNTSKNQANDIINENLKQRKSKKELKKEEIVWSTAHKIYYDDKKAEKSTTLNDKSE